MRVFASDGLVQSETQFDILVLNTNAAPQLAVPADRTLREGDTIEFILSARDDDGDPLHFTSVNLPTGATLQPASGLFSWTPGFDQHGNYQISLRVGDGQATTQQTFRLQVLNVNGPVDLLPLGQFEIVEDQLLALRIAARDPDYPQTTDSPIVFDQDPNIDAGQGLPALVYTHSSLPAGTEFDSQTGLFTWSPDHRQSGEYSITFTVADDGDGTGTATHDTATLRIRVLNDNGARKSWRSPTSRSPSAAVSRSPFPRPIRTVSRSI